MASLNNAIQLIREGQKDDARQILEPLLRAEPANIQAWFWYVETCSTLEKRIRVLEVCLKMNPGNSQVTEALRTLRNQPPPVPPPPVQMTEPEALYDPTPYSAMYEEEEEEVPIDSIPSSYSYAPTSYSYEPAESSFGTGNSEPWSYGKKKNTWEGNNVGYVDNSMLSKPGPAAKSYAFYDVWITAMAMVNMGAYEDALRDPEAGAGRAFEWMGYSGIVSGLILALTLPLNPQFSELTSISGFMGMFGNNTLIFIVMFGLVMALVMPILSIISLAISSAVQNILAVFMGGDGDYGRTAYALAAYLAPFAILSAALSSIPVVGQCISSFLGIYSLVLNVRALQVAHALSTGKALAVIFIPGILLFVFACLIILVIGFPSVG